MKTLLKIALLLLAILVIAVAGVGIYIATYDLNEHKDMIASRVRAQTGRDIMLKGPIEHSLYPWLGIRLEDVSLSEDPAFGSAPFLATGLAAVRIKLIPLLKGEFEIDTVTLHDTTVNLITTADGRNNWDSLATSAEEDADSTGGEPFTLPRVVIGGIDIRNLKLNIRDDRSGQITQVQELAFTTDALTLGEPLSMKLSGLVTTNQPENRADLELDATLTYDLGGQAYTLAPFALQAVLSGSDVPGGSAPLTLDTSLAVDLDAGNLSVPMLELALLETTLTAGITGSDIQGSPNWQGNIDIHGNDLAAVMRALGQDKLASQISATGSSAIDLSSSFTMNTDSGELVVPALEASVLGGSISGKLSASALNSDAPEVRGELDASGPNLPTLLQLAGRLQGTDSPLLQAGRQMASNPGSKAFSISTRFDARPAAGDVNLPSFEASLLGTDISGNFTATGLGSEIPAVQGQLEAGGPDLPTLLQLAGQLQGSESALLRTGRQLANYPGSKAFSISSRFDARPAAGDISLPSLQASALGFVLSGTVDAREMDSNSGRATGELSLTGSKLKPLLRALEQDAAAEVLDALSLQVRLGGNRQALNISPLGLTLDLRGSEVPGGAATLALNADTRVNLQAGTADISRFSLAGLGLDLNGKLRLSELDAEQPTASGRLDLPAFNLRRFLASINQPVPVTSDDSALQTVAMGSDFNFSDGVIALSGLSATLDDSTLSGSFSADTGTRGAIRFELALDAIDIDRYLAPMAEEAETPAASQAELPVGTLRGLDIDGTVRAGTVMVSGLTLSNIRATVKAENGLIQLAPLEAGLYEGRYSGDIRLDVSGETPAATVATALDNVNIAPLMTDYMGSTFVSGHGDIKLNVSGRGANTGTIRDSLAGSGSIALRDGILTGVDVAGVLRQVETMIRNRQAASIVRGEQTPFDSFSASFAIDQGVVTTNDLLIASPGFSVAGRGTLVDLRSETISFNLLATVDETTVTNDTEEYDLGGYSLPIACSGQATSPRCLPDIAQIARAAFANEVRSQIGGLLQRALGVEEQAQGETAPAEGSSEQLQESEEEPAQDPRDTRRELINDALNRIFQ